MFGEANGLVFLSCRPRRFIVSAPTFAFASRCLTGQKRRLASLLPAFNNPAIGLTASETLVIVRRERIS